MTRTILITGCSSGLGRLTALHFAEAGWNVVATMRKPDGELGERFPGRLVVEALDVTDPASIEAAVAASVERFGGLDVVVNNAGASVLSVFEATSPDIARQLFETNFFGVMNVTRAVLPHLRASRGAIVNVTSGVGFMAVPLLTLYVASKHAVEGFSESLAYELESQGVRVRLIEPGAMRNTSFSASTMAISGSAKPPESYAAYFDHALKAMIDYPFPPTAESAVVAAIDRAATDRTPGLVRYPVGPDIEEYARLRWSTSEAEYRDAMRRLTGQSAWAEMAAAEAATA